MLVDFYHLTGTPIERVLPRICERVIANGEKLLVVAEAGLVDQLDRMLWTYSPDSFLPHGRGGTPVAERQPILLAETAQAGNGAGNVALADGRWREEALGFARAFYFFDSTHLDEARGVWRTLKDREGVERRYWKQQEDGRWVQGP